MSDTLTFKYRVHRAGPHVRVTVFVGPSGRTLANCGELVLDSDQYEALRAMSQCGADMLAPLIEVVLEDGG